MKRTATWNYRLEQVAAVLVALFAAALTGWAVALAFGLWGQSQLQRLTTWTPFALTPAKLEARPALATPSAHGGTARLVGVAGDRAYFVRGGAANSSTLSLTVGEQLPSGEKLLRIDRDGVLIAAAGGELRVPVLADRVAPASKRQAGSPTLMACRLAGADRVAAIFVETGVIKALAAERSTLARMFERVTDASGGIRAKGTGGITAMFAIVDGDVLLRANGVPLRAGDAIASEVLALLDRGESVVVEGVRQGAPRRWVYAPSSCKIAPSSVSTSSG